MWIDIFNVAHIRYYWHETDFALDIWNPVQIKLDHDLWIIRNDMGKKYIVRNTWTTCIETPIKGDTADENSN